MRRISDSPVPATITERSKLAQTMRNELDSYKRINGPFATAQRDACLRRIERAWFRLMSLEGFILGDDRR